MKRPPGRHNIRQALWPFAVPIGDMAPHPDNPNNGDDEGLEESLLTSGQFRCILQWVELPDGEPVNPPLILAGHTTQRAALALRWDMIAAEPFIGTPDEALVAMLADNGYARRARMDPGLEVAALQSLESLVGTSYVEDDLARLAAKLDRPLVLPPEPQHTGGEGGRQCPDCGHRCLTAPS